MVLAENVSEEKRAVLEKRGHVEVDERHDATAGAGEKKSKTPDRTEVRELKVRSTTNKGGVSKQKNKKKAVQTQSVFHNEIKLNAIRAIRNAFRHLMPLLSAPVGHCSCAAVGVGTADPVAVAVAVANNKAEVVKGDLMMVAANQLLP